MKSTVRFLRGLDSRFVWPRPSSRRPEDSRMCCPRGATSLPSTCGRYRRRRRGRSGQLALMEATRGGFIGGRPGEWPLGVALSAWGTANMRTGGIDISQALALQSAHVRCGRRTSGRLFPLCYHAASRACEASARGYHPFRVSGLFRGLFPKQMDIIGSAVRAIAMLDEPDEANPILPATCSYPAEASRARGPIACSS